MYEYEAEKPAIFTERGQVMFLCIRDNVKRLLKEAGAVRMQEAMAGTGRSWTMLACVDRLVELGELVEVTEKGKMSEQYRVFVANRNSPPTD